MSTALKRQAQSKLCDAPSSKNSKFYDLNLIAKDISMLEAFYDFIDDENDIINEYLSVHDFNEFLNYFKSYHLYKSGEFALVFKVSSEILMRIAGDLNEKFSLIGQNFADLFVENHKAIIHQYLVSTKSKSGAKSCIKFVTGLILQGSDVALKIATSFNVFQTSFIKQLFVRSVNDDDVRTCVLNCFAAFFVLGNNVVIRKLCEYKTFFGCLLRDLCFDKYDNVLLIIEILHDKIIKNNAISKTIKVKLFSASVLNYLITVYEWKGEALNYDSFKRLNVVDDRSISIRSQLHLLMMDLCSSNFGIVFNDNLCGQAKARTLNKALFKLLTADVMRDFLMFPLKNEIVKTILRHCTDIVPNFIEHLAALMEKIVPEARGDILRTVIDCYGVIENEKIDSILTESLSFMDGDKFVDVAMLLCAPTKTLSEIILTTEKVCCERVNELKKAVISNCERVLTWINVTDCFQSFAQRIIMRSNFHKKIEESLLNLAWTEEFERLSAMELNDRTLFPKTKKTIVAFKEFDTENVILNIDEEIDEEIKNNINTLTNGDTDDETGHKTLKKCIKYFLKSPFTCVGVLVAIAGCVVKRKIMPKKKQRKQLFEAMISDDIIGKYWTVVCPENGRNEMIRNCIFDVIVALVDSSNALMIQFYERVHPMKLLSVYGGTLSPCDQRILYLLSIHQLYDISVPQYNVIMFGSSVNEHYQFRSNDSVTLWRPIIESQCFNLLIDERMTNTVNHFPVNRLSPVSPDNKFHLESPNRSLYDPCFLLEWITQLLARNTNTENEVMIGQTVELKVLFSRKIIPFLIMCQSSNNAKVRAVSRALLARLVERLEDGDNAANECPMKMQIQMILYHMFNTINSTQNKIDKRLPSVFTNIYARMLQLLNTPDKKMYSPLWEVMITKECFDVKYVPEFVYMMYSDKEDYRTRQLWMVQLLADSVKNYDDFLVMVNTNVFVDVLTLYTLMEQSGKMAVLCFVRRCVAIVQVAEKLRRYPGFVTWLVCVAESREERENREVVADIVQTFLASLNGTEDVESVKMALTMSW